MPFRKEDRHGGTLSGVRGVVARSPATRDTDGSLPHRMYMTRISRRGVRRYHAKFDLDRLPHPLPRVDSAEHDVC